MSNSDSDRARSWTTRFHTPIVECGISTSGNPRTGRCAVALAALPRIAAHRPDAAVVWFDAHTDINTPKSAVLVGTRHRPTGATPDRPVSNRGRRVRRWWWSLLPAWRRASAARRHRCARR
ncbi:arginase family protein [Saccharopolyspora sp. NPDC000995]